MELASRRSPNPQRADLPASVGIIDTIVMKESLAIDHAPGIVAVLDSFRPASHSEGEDQSSSHDL